MYEKNFVLPLTNYNCNVILQNSQNEKKNEWKWIFWTYNKYNNNNSNPAYLIILFERIVISSS